jgi:parallel beta-helix repeat protein
VSKYSTGAMRRELRRAARRAARCGLVLAVIFAFRPAWAATYYLSPAGSDSNPGMSALPWKTFRKAASMVRAGDTVIVRDGTYAGGVTLETPGTSVRPIVFKASGKKAIIQGSGTERDAVTVSGYSLGHPWWKGTDMYVCFEGFTIRNAARAGFRISCAHHVTVRKCLLTRNGTWGIFTDYSNYSLLEDNECSYSGVEHGIYVSNSSDFPTIRGNRVHHNAASGIQINADPAMEDGDGITTGAVIERNIVYENGRRGGAAINLASVRNSLVRNNLLYDNYAGGIACWADGNGPAWGCKNNRFYNNTIYFRSAEGRWAISLKEGSSGNRVRNNILCGGRDGALEFDDEQSVRGLRMDYNLFYRAGSNLVVTWEDEADYTLKQWRARYGQDANSIAAAPSAVFVSVAKADYRLRKGSPGINAGDPAKSFNDPDGSRNDLGAYGGPKALAR